MPTAVRPLQTRLLGPILTCAFTLAASWLLTAPTGGPLAGQEMRRMTPDQALLMREVGAIFEIGDDGLEVTMVLPKEARPESHRDVDLAQGDVVLMMTGKKIETLADARSIYEGTVPGDEIALGVDRGGQKRIVRFAKVDPADLPDSVTIGHGDGGGGGAVRIIRGGPGGAIEPIGGLGVVVRDASNDEEPDAVGAVVEMTLPGQASVLQEGDVVTKAGGEEIWDAADLAAAVEKASVGSTIQLEVLRGDETLTLEATKSDAQVGISTRTIG